MCCPFTWEFELFKVRNASAQEFLLGHLVGPLVRTVHCLEKRTEHLKQQFIELEDEYKKRLTPLEKNTYKSRFIDEEFNWQQYMPPKNNDKIDKMEFSDAGRYFMSQNTKNLCGINETNTLNISKNNKPNTNIINTNNANSNAINNNNNSNRNNNFKESNINKGNTIKNTNTLSGSEFFVSQNIPISKEKESKKHQEKPLNNLTPAGTSKKNTRKSKSKSKSF